MARLRIPLEFNPNKTEDMKLYEQLLIHSNPAAYVKDVLRGVLPIPNKIVVAGSETYETNTVIDNEDLLDV